jgi:HlyD family secretion protein
MTEPVPQAPKRGGRVWRWVLALALAAGAAAGAYVYLGPQTAAVPAGETAAAPAAPRRITALGEVLPVTNRVTVAAPTGQDAGRIAEILVAEGDPVVRGQVLAVLDTEPVLRAELDQAIAEEAARKVALAARTADLDASEGQLNAQVSQLKVALGKAQLELDRMIRLTDTGVYEPAALADRRLDVESARFNLRNTELQLERNRLRVESGLRIDEASAKAEFDAAVAARARAEAEHAKSSIRAPVDGRILAIFGRIGQQIDTEGFAQMGDTAQMTVRAEVYESDVSGVTLGQSAQVTSRALQGELAGAVSRIGVRISDQSILSTDPAAIVDARVVEVWITLDASSSQATENLTGLQVLVTFAPPEDDGA